MWPTTVLSVFLPWRNFCAENFEIFFYEIKLLFTFTFLLMLSLIEGHYVRVIGYAEVTY